MDFEVNGSDRKATKANMILKERVVNINMRYIVQPANDMYDDDRCAGAILLRSHVAQPRGASLVLRVNATRHRHPLSCSAQAGRFRSHHHPLGHGCSRRRTLNAIAKGLSKYDGRIAELTQRSAQECLQLILFMQMIGWRCKHVLV